MIMLANDVVARLIDVKFAPMQCTTTVHDVHASICSKITRLGRERGGDGVWGGGETHKELSSSRQYKFRGTWLEGG